MEFWGTFGPSCSNKDVIIKLFQAGMTGMRLNLSHVSLKDSAEMIETFHNAARISGVKPQLIIDLQGPELRVGRLETPLELAAGCQVQLGNQGIPIPDIIFPALTDGVEILLDDGRANRLVLPHRCFTP